MPTLLIGSHALNEILGRVVRQPDDMDVFAPEWADTIDGFWHPLMAQWIVPGTSRTATLDELYTIKVSHSYWELKNGSWRKHVEDAMLLKQAGAKLDQGLHDLLYKVWTDQHGSKKVNLEQDKGSFFKDAVVRKYDHDSIHDSVAYGDRPMYEEILKEGSTVAVDMTKLKALSYEDKIRLFKEEVFATALERIVIPKDYKCSPMQAYAWALRRTITSLTKGWSAQFMVENFDRFRNSECDYVSRHKENSDRLVLL